MNNPARKFSPGDPSRQQAETLNRWQNAADYVEAQERRPSSPAADPKQGTRWGGMVKIRNETGSAVQTGQILGISGILISHYSQPAEYIRRPVFRGIVPALPDHEQKFAVVLGNGPDNSIVKAFVSGHVACKVNILDPDHQFAEVVNAEKGHLQSADEGIVRILHASDDLEETGIVWCQCVIGGGGGGGSTDKYCVLTTDLTAGTATADILEPDGITSVETGVTLVDRLDLFPGAKEGAGGWAQKDGDVWLAKYIACIQEAP